MSLKPIGWPIPSRNFPREASPEAGIIQLPNEKKENQPGQLPSDQNAGQSSKQDQPDGRQPNQAGGKGQGSDSEGDGEDSQEPGLPPGPQSGNCFEWRKKKDCFTIIVNSVWFYISKCQLLPSRRGQEDACTINACRRNSYKSLPLDEIEEAVGVEKRNRYSTYNNKALSYLLAYGDDDTLWALQRFYPTSLLSERDGHLVADVDVNYCEELIIQYCETCSQPLLSQHSLIRCPRHCQHVYHTRCLSQFFSTDEADIGCSFCQEYLSPHLSRLLSEGLGLEFYQAVKSGNSDLVKALLETAVDIDAKNADGSTLIWLVCSTYKPDMIKLLQEKGADVHPAGYEGLSLLEVAVLASRNHKMKASQCVICTATGCRLWSKNGAFVCKKCCYRQQSIYDNLRRLRQRSGQVDSITDSVYLGNYYFARDKKALQRMGITSILLCDPSLEQHFPNDFNYCRIAFENEQEKDIFSYFSDAWRFIETELANSPDNKVLVHCHAGMSRSNSIVISYVMKKRSMSYKQAFDFVEQRRASFFSNTVLINHLKKYEHFLDFEEVEPPTESTSFMSLEGTVQDNSGNAQESRKRTSSDRSDSSDTVLPPQKVAKREFSTFNENSASLETEEKTSRLEQQYPQSFFLSMPVDVLNMIFKWLPMSDQQRLGATCRMLREYYCNNVLHFALEPMVHYYFDDWMTGEVEKEEHWFQEHQKTFYEKFRLCDVPDHLIEASRKKPSYSLALLRCLINRKKMRPHHYFDLFRDSSVVKHPIQYFPDVTFNEALKVCDEKPSVANRLLRRNKFIGCDKRPRRGDLHPLAVNPVGQLAIFHQGDAIAIWDFNLRDQPVLVCELPRSGNDSGTCFWLPKNLLAVVPDEKNIIEIWDIAAKKRIVNLEGHNDTILSIVPLAYGRLATGSEDDSVKIWQAKKGTCEATYEPRQARPLKVLSDGRLVSITHEYAIAVQDIQVKMIPRSSSKGIEAK